MCLRLGAAPSVLDVVDCRGRILEITQEITATAPEPVLSVVVRQDGQEIDTSLNVRPGAPLDMEIKLDAASSSTYGIIVSDMIVSDTKKQEELLLTNGSVWDGGEGSGGGGAIGGPGRRDLGLE